jgi:hypothetical protein
MMTQPKGGRVRAAALAVCGIAVLATAACSAAAPASSAGSRQPAEAASVPLLVNCGQQVPTRPSHYYDGCLNGPFFTGLHWATWGSSSALASGTYTVDDCVPNCVAGHYYGYPVLVVLWDVQPRPGHTGERDFTRMTVIYTGNRSGKLSHLPQTWTASLTQYGGA